MPQRRTCKITMTVYALEEDAEQVKSSLMEDWFGRHDCPMASIRVEVAEPTEEEDRSACHCLDETVPGAEHEA